MKKLLIFLLLFCVLCLLPRALAEDEYRDLSVGMNGSDVQRLKKAMYWLGYFNSPDLDGNFTATTEKRVKQLQKNNGLEETGIADAALQALVFSGNAVKTASAPKPSPTPGPAPTPMPTADVEQYMPPLTEEGFLPEDASVDEYIYTNADAGVWIYVSPHLCVTISRYQVELKRNDTILWYEADIHCTPEEPLQSWLTDGKVPGRSYSNPVKLARQNRAVLAFADDHYGDRRYKGRTVGVIVRNGEIYSEKTYKSGNKYFPNLDILALFQDGSMKTFQSAAHTGQEYLDMGVKSTYAFGPILVQNGKLADDMRLEGRWVNREPRCALGMIEPYHYLLLVAKGRAENINGVSVPWLAERMLERGVQEALNLDGGGTACLMFMGQPLNRKNINQLRVVTSITGAGQSEQVPEK